MRSPRASRPTLRQLRELNSPSPTTTPIPLPSVTTGHQDDTSATRSIPPNVLSAADGSQAEDFLSSDFGPERLEFPFSVTSPPALDSVSVLSVTPAVAVTAVNDAVIRQITLPVRLEIRGHSHSGRYALVCARGQTSVSQR